MVINSLKRSVFFLISLCCVITAISNAQELQSDTGTGDITAEPRSALSGFEIIQEYGSDVKAAIPALLEGLRSKEVNIRRNAAFALGEIGPEAEPAINDLAKVLIKDPDREVRRNAAFALGEIGFQSTPVLVKALSDRDSRVRRNVAAALVRIGEPAVPFLTAILQDTSPLIRKNAAGILGRIGPKAKDAIPALERALDDEDKAFCWTVKQALRNIKQVTVEDLIACLNDKDIIIRSKAVKTLGEKGVKTRNVISALVFCLNDEKAEVRKNAAFALAEIGEPAVPALIEALESRDFRIRKNAAFSLGEMGELAEEAVPGLEKLLNDTNSKVRWCADNAIKKIKSE